MKEEIKENKVVIAVATPLYPPQIGGPATHVVFLERMLSKEDFCLKLSLFSHFSYLPKGIKHVVYFLSLVRLGVGSSFIYALDPVSVGLPAVLAAKILGKKLVLRVGGDYAWEQGTQRFGVTLPLDVFVHTKQKSRRVRLLQWLQSYVARNAHRVIAPSFYLKGIIETWGVDASRIEVIYSQPEEQQKAISRSEARKIRGLHENECVALSAGRLVAWKGYEGLIDAAVLLQKTLPIHLYIAGSGPHHQALVEYSKEKKAESFVTLLGQVSKSDLSVWLAASDVFLLNTKYEGLSHMLLEAFAARVPVVTTPVGGNLELVEHQTTGLLVKPDNAPLFAEAIHTLLTDRSLASKLSEEAHESLIRFNPSVATEKLRALFLSI